MNCHALRQRVEMENVPKLLPGCYHSTPNHPTSSEGRITPFRQDSRLMACPEVRRIRPRCTS